MSKVILITGASSGIGKCCAKYLVKKGFIVYGTSRKAVAADNKGIKMLQMDVTLRQSVQEGVDKIIAEQGCIDILINNAGMGIGGAIECATEEDAALQMNTNFMGMVNVTSAVLPHFRKQRSGKIINMSSVAGVMGIPYQGFYSASKFAIEGYSETLDLEVNRFGIKVVLIEPGDFCTGFTGSRVMCQNTQNNSDYKDSFAKTYSIIEHEELNGCKPEKIAKLMHKIVLKKNPKFRYPIGKTVQILSIYVKRFLPYKLNRMILKSYYKL